MKRRSVILIAVAWMLVLVGVGASALTLAVINRQSGQGGLKLVSESDYEAIERYRRLEEVRKTLSDEYYVPLDEDELVRFLSDAYYDCPYYRNGDEYRVVRKQL